MPLTPAESASVVRLSLRTRGVYDDDNHRELFESDLGDFGEAARGIARIATEADTAIADLTVNYPNATDAAAAGPLIPVYNLFPDSGRFADALPSTILAGNFQALDFLNPFNGASAWTSAGQFNHNGTQPEPVSSLLSHTTSRPVGPEFYVAEITAGSGTLSATVDNGTSYYLLTTNGNAMLPYLCTMGFFARVVSGGVHIGATHTQDGVEYAAGPLPSSVWRYVTIKQTNTSGVNNLFPLLRATPGTVLQVALPSLVTGHFASLPFERALPILSAEAYT